MESNSEIARIPFAVNEQDFERETDFIHTKVLAGMKTVTQVQLTVSLLLVTGLLAVTGWQRHLAIIALLLLLTVLVVAWKGISGWMLRRSSQKSAKTMRDAGDSSGGRRVPSGALCQAPKAPQAGASHGDCLP